MASKPRRREPRLPVAASSRPGPAAAESERSPLLPLLPWLGVAWLFVYWLLFFSAALPNQPDHPRRSDLVLILPEILSDPLGLEVPGPVGWQYLAQRIPIAAFAALIATASLASGRLILRGLRLFDALDTPTRLSLAGGVGLSAVSLLTLGLGLAGLLWRWVFVGGFFSLIFWDALLTVRSRRVEPPRIVAGDDAPRWVKLSCGGVCVLFLCFMALGSMLPSTDFDVKEYHLQGPKEYLQDGRIHFLPHNMYTSFPFLTEMLSLAGMVVSGGWERGSLAGQAVLMLFAPLTAVGTYCVTKRLAGNAAGWFAAAIFLSVPWTYRISIIAYTEGALCCFVILSALAWQVWHEFARREPRDERAVRSALLLLGFLAGSAISTKYPGLVQVAIPIGLAMVVAQRRLASGGHRSVLRTACWYALGILVAFGPWMAKNLVETGNPVYPLAYSVFGGADWDPELNAKFKAGHSTTGTFWNPRVIPDVALYNDWQSPLLFGLAPLAFLSTRRRGLWLVAADALWILAMWFLLTHRLDRFWVPVIPTLAVLAGAGLKNLLLVPFGEDEQNPFGHFARFAAIPAFALTAFATVYNFGFITLPYAGYNAYLRDLDFAWRETTNFPIALVESLELPRGSTVLFVGEAQVFNAHFPLLYNTVFDYNLLEQMAARKTGPNAWELLPAEEIRANLRAAGATHVFVNWQEVLRYRTTYGYTAFISPARLQQLVDAGVLRELPLDPAYAERDLSILDALSQAQVRAWGPELQRPGDQVLLFQLYEVADR